MAQVQRQHFGPDNNGSIPADESARFSGVSEAEAVCAIVLSAGCAVIAQRDSFGIIIIDEAEDASGNWVRWEVA